MDWNNNRIAQLEEEVRILKTQLEQAQDDVENELWRALKNMPDGAVYHSVRDTKTGILKFDYVSGPWEKMSGLTIEETTADLRNVFKHIVPEDLQSLLKIIEESFNPLTNFSAEIRYIHPLTGKERWFEISSYPHRDGEYVYAYGFIFDVSARKEAEQKIVSQNERLLALDKMPDGVLFRSLRDVRTGNIKFDYVSGTWGKVMGISEKDTLADSKHIFVNVMPDDLILLKHHIYESNDPQKKLYVEIRYIHPVTHKTHWIQVSAYPRREGDYVISDGFIFDITARKKAELELYAEKERLETLGNNLPEGVLYQMILNQKTDHLRLSYVSGRWEEITGITAEAALNSIDVFFAKVHPDDLPLVMQEIDKSIHQTTDLHAEFRITVQGSIRWMQMSSRINHRDNLMIWDGIMLDITRRKQAERELEAEKTRLQTLGDNLPGSALFQFSRDVRTGQMNVLYVSGTWESVSGISAADALADVSNIFDRVEPSHLPELIQSLEDSARTMTDHVRETRFVDRWVHVIAHPRREGTFVIWDSIMTNVTERKEMEYELKAEKNRLQMLGDNLHNSSLFQFILDNQTRQMSLSYVSATWEAVTGIAADVATSDISKVFSSIASEDFPAFMDSIEESARTMSIHKSEIRVGDRWMRIVSRPRNEEEHIIWDGIITDVTEQKNNEAELDKYREDLEYLVQKRTDELNAANEELFASNEEIFASNEELNNKNDQLVNEMEARMSIMKQLEENEVKLSEALAANEYQLVKMNLVIEASGIGLWEMLVTQSDPLSPDNTYLWSDEYRRLLGYSSEADFPNVFSSWSNILHPDDMERTMDAYTRHLLDKTGKTPYSIEYRLLKKNGEYAQFKSYGATLRDKEGHALRVAGGLRSI